MNIERSATVLLTVLVSSVSIQSTNAQQSQLEAALGDLYGYCLFDGVEDNPFSQAASLARRALAPGISNFIEANLASIPLSPPNLEASASSKAA